MVVAARMGGRTAAAVPAADLFSQIGAFLHAQRLSPEPANYAFAHAILSQPGGPLAKAVAELTDGGVRLTQRDIEALGARVVAGGTDAEAGGGATQAIVATTQMQVDGFADMVEGIWAETGDFGRDLASAVDAIREVRAADAAGEAVAARTITEVVRLSAGMVDRVSMAEARLAQATREAADLRAKLDEARDNARRDPLTDLPNRRAFEEAFAARGEGAVHLAVCDVDHFKQVNDRFGHAVGDRVLRAIGQALAEACPGDFVARYGGEEFVVLFTGVERPQALATLERARIHVADKRYRLRESDEGLGSVTFSAGMTGAMAGDTARSLFLRADRLLYQAKNDGRNQIILG